MSLKHPPLCFLQESTIIFRRYTTLHLFIVTGLFSFSAVFIGISASKHNTAAAQCVQSFFPTSSRYACLLSIGADADAQTVQQQHQH